MREPELRCYAMTGAYDYMLQVIAPTSTPTRIYHA